MPNDPSGKYQSANERRTESMAWMRARLFDLHVQGRRETEEYRELTRVVQARDPHSVKYGGV